MTFLRLHILPLGAAAAVAIAAGGTARALQPAATAPAKAATAASAPALTALEEAVTREAEATQKAFNAGDAAALGGMFLEGGELVDERGNVHAGRQAITDLFKAFFAKFPKASMEMQPTSARPVGDGLVVEEGERRITAAAGDAVAQVHYVAVRSRQGDRWPIASYHEFADEPLPTPREILQSAAWLVGEWLDESPEGRTAIAFRWSEDGNFLLGDYTMTGADGAVSTSTQRIGWDPVNGRLRSWTFDSDGGFSVGEWDAVAEGWAVKSEATMPDGTTGSATMTIAPKDANHFVVRATDRIVGGVEEPDFEVTISRRPPAPGVKK
ncbi:MAG: SgcJ/EcaC family oxidoreductase [Planctomycetaceae bacterium]